MPALTSKLEAVNSMLGHIGESPVNSISDTNSLPISAVTATTVLDEVSREVQAEGWHFNTEESVLISPALDGTITLDDDIIEIDPHDNTLDIVQRGASLYNRTDNTSVFTADVAIDLVRWLDWDSLPEVARRYIILRASRVFQGRMVGSEELTSIIARDEYMARASLMETDSRTSDRTVFDNFDAAFRIGTNRPRFY